MSVAVYLLLAAASRGPIFKFVFVEFWFKMLLLPSTFAENLDTEEPTGYVDKEVFRSLVLKVSIDTFLILINIDDH